MNPPFRADQVGSLLRPEKLKRAREQFLGPQTPTSALGPKENVQLRKVEDECVRECIAMQERIGLGAVTDGEFRRRSWWLELILGWEGFAADRTGSAKLKWHNASGVTQGFSDLNVVGKIRWRPSSVVQAFSFLKKSTKAVPKVTLPAPNCVHYYTGGKLGFYKDKDAFWADLVSAYRKEIHALVEAGARYIQLDDTSIAFICDPAHREYVRSWGEDPDGLLHIYTEKINAVLEGLPRDVTVTLHQCRGNREGNWAAEGGYEPLRLMPKLKKVVLGVVSIQTPSLESEDELMKKIESASKFVPLDQLALSPQCGFASSIRGNPLTQADQEAKLARIVETAGRVWGSH